MIDLALDSGDPWLEGISRQRLELGQMRLNFAASDSRLPGAEAELRSAGQPSAAVPAQSNAGRTRSATQAMRTQADPEPFLPFAQGGFRTPSGKAELYSEAVKALGLDPVAAFRPPTESRHGQASTSALPLELLARKSDNFLNSTFSNVPSVQAMEEPGLLEISAADARARGIADGDQVRVFNRRGDILLKARVDGKVQPGVVSASLNWAKKTPGFRA